MTRPQGYQSCEPCKFQGRTKPATRSYISPSAGLTLACESCYTEQTRVIRALTEPAGPYAGEIGSKGGGASFDAAEAMKTKAGKLRLRCLQTIAEQGPLGADKLAFIMDEDEDNVSPRLSELTKDEYGAVLSKGPRTARTRRGNPAHVYQLTDAGRAWASQQGKAA